MKSRICMVCTEKLPLPPVRGGAIQTYIDGVLPYLREHYQITVIGRSDPDLPPDEVREGVRFLRVDPGNHPQDYFRAVSGLLANERFDLVELFNRPAFLPQIASAAPGTPLVLSLHNEMMAPHRIDSGLARTVLDGVSAVCCISEFIRQGIDRSWPGYRPKLRTIRSGVDLDRFRPGWDDPGRRDWVRRKLGLEGRRVILHVSRLSAKKGNHLVLEALPEVRSRHPDAILLSVGSRWYGSNDPDDFVAALHARGADLGTEAVRFAGFVPPAEIPDLFLAGDLFVHASQWEEPLARVHYEAMAAGLPIITTNRGGNAEVVEEGPAGNGIFARPFDSPAGFAAAISTLLDHPEAAAAIGRRGRRLAEERYSFARVARELEEVLTACASS